MEATSIWGEACGGDASRTGGLTGTGEDPEEGGSAMRVRWRGGGYAV